MFYLCSKAINKFSYQRQILIYPTYILHHFDLIVRLVVEHEGDPGVPDLFQLQVHETLLWAGVEPLGQVWVAVRVLGRGSHLDVIHTPLALDLVVGVAEENIRFKNIAHYVDGT